MDPLWALRQVAFRLERAGEPTYRVRAFRRAADILAGLPDGELDRRVAAGTLTDHSPRLTVASGLTAERLRRQLEVVAEPNVELAPFLILHCTGRLVVGKGRPESTVRAAP